MKISVDKPDIIIPRKLKKQPIYWYVLIFCYLINILENSNVVITVPPANICQIDPGIKFKAKYCNVEDKKSNIAGIANKNGFIVIFLPYFNASFYL